MHSTHDIVTPQRNAMLPECVEAVSVVLDYMGAQPVIRESNVIILLKNVIRGALCCFCFIYLL